MTRKEMTPETRDRVDIILKRNAAIFANTGNTTPKKTMKRIKAIERRSFRYFRYLAPDYFDALLRASD